VEHADEAAAAFADPALHSFTGGEPENADGLRLRYARQVVGCSPDGTQTWLNWIVRQRDTGGVVGTVQATVSGGIVEVAWVVATAHQGRGYAREAASAMAGFLRSRGLHAFVAHVHPDHRASAAVARAIGLRPTGDVVDGEVRWRS
jgi:RimJ/RimL family protein N-acetyltransferase